MATLALAAAGAAVGGALLPAGVSLFGATLSGAVIGSQVGALAGSFIDQALLSPSGSARTASGPRLSDLKVTASTEGAAIPRLYGRSRLGGQLIWATDIEEERVVSGASSAKGGGGSSGSGGAQYLYYANFAIALCEGPITSIGRVWADGKEIDLSDYTWRIYTGTESQTPDSLIAAREGAGSAPAYRGVAYIVFERMPLARFANRIPQLSFEVYRAVDPFESQVRGVVLIPGCGEFVYAPEPVTRDIGFSESEAENIHTRQGGTDWDVAIDQLQATLPNARSVSLVVSWFGTDLRAGHCQLRPAVDTGDKSTSPIAWSVAGLDRTTAPVVSTVDGRAAYGGTPSDQTVIAAIQNLRSRGFSVTLTPFILMDVPAGNTLPDPYTSAAGQPAYPWRGRITVDPAPGRPGSPDKTATAASQLAAFIGTAAPGDFAIVDGAVAYSGPDEWSFRRLVLHYAHLAVAAGGVDAFVLGTELRGLTQVRSSASAYPFVTALMSLAADVKSVLGSSTKVTYAADWSEYFGHQPQDGSNDVYFHLDPLWSSPHIDAIGIDLYWPLSDWRDGVDHLDRAAGARSIYDLDYLKSNIGGGEGFDWYYASAADRDAQVRTPITDGAGKPWVFRYKDLKSWWLNQHYNRPAGSESASPTSWVPQSKPVWVMEIGCPAADRGSNQPNVFVDPKSSESFLPYYSRGTRDDLIQRRYLQAFHEAFDPAHEGYMAGSNPTSAMYGGPMLALDRMHVYAWDARPYPAFPAKLDVWGDGPNWRLGHWLTGRIASQPLNAVVSALLEDYGFAAFDVAALEGIVPGFVVDRVMSARDALQPLSLAYFFDALESVGAIRFRHRGAEASVATLSPDVLVETRPGADLLTLTRAQETELPASAKLNYSASETDYRQAVAEARRLVGASGRVSLAELPIVMDAEQATQIAESWLFEAWAARERASFALPPSRLAIEPGDVVSVELAGNTRLLRISEIGDHGARDVEARSIDPDVYAQSAAAPRPQASSPDVHVGQPLGIFLDLPLLIGSEQPHIGYVAAAQKPWPGPIAFYRSPETWGYTLRALVTVAATTGVTLDPLAPGPEGRVDRAARLRVRLDQGELASISLLALLAGGNAAAIQNAAGDWEVLQFQSASLVAPATYELSTLLRGQLGTEDAMSSSLPAGARFVLLDSALAPVDMGRSDVGLPFNWRFGPSSRDLGHASYAGATHTFTGVGLRPLSPVHVRATRTGGDVVISWIRRTRVGGDNWAADEVPLGEESERYEVDILDGSTVKRTLTATSASVTYTAAQQTDDFGTPQPSYTLRVYQIAAGYGRGGPRQAVVP
ncbi:MAG: baseplate multidomain protein megatron [Bacteroidota bacterium]